MKKQFLFLSLILAALLSLFAIGTFAEGDEPALKIEAANLEFADNVYLWYAVSHEGIDAENVELLFFTEPQSDYTEDNADYRGTLIDRGVTVLDKENCAIFKNDTLRAKNMADDIYAVAYAEVDGEEYYSAPVKYSILQYAYNKLGKTGTASENEALKNALVSMLEYGASIQLYTDYNTDRLANADFYQVKVEGGTLSDGFAKGLFLAGETVSLSAPAEKDGVSFTAWKNSKNEKISANSNALIHATAKNETYTAVYGNSEHLHVYIPVTTPPSCTQQGYITYTCSCGKSYSDNYINALGHAYSDWIVEIPATCESNGVLGHYSCSLCRGAFDANKNILDSTIIPATHIGGTEISNYKAPTEYQDGYSGDTICLTCRKIISYGNVLPHTSNEPAIIVSEAIMEKNTVKIVISIVNNPGIVSLKFDVLYDDILSIQSIEFSDAFGAYVTSPEPYINPQTFNWINPSESMTNDGEFVTITFSLNTDITDKPVAEIRILPDNTNIFDSELNPIRFDVAGASITLTR